MLSTATFLEESVFSGLFLWLGLYLITRDTPGRGWWQRPAVATGVSIICIAWYMLGDAMGFSTVNFQEIALWIRLTWWSAALASPAFFHGISLVTAYEERSPRARFWNRLATMFFLVYAILLVTVGTTTKNEVFQFDKYGRQPEPPYTWELPPSYPLYGLWAALNIGTLLVSTAMLLWRYATTRSTAPAQFRWLGIGAIILTLGSVIGFAEAIFPTLSLRWDMTGILLTLGLFTIGYGVAEHNVLFHDQSITRDFYRSLAGAAVTSTVFGASNK